jgi:hypothetical protein
MEDKMNNLKNILLILVLCFLCFMDIKSLGQNPDPFSFFPHHLGDYWEYQHYEPNCNPFAQSSRKVILDSLLPDSNSLLRIGSQMYFSEYFIDRTTYEVKAQSDSFALYKLDAQLGEWWYTNYDDSLNYHTGKVIDIYNSTIHGIPSTIKIIDFWGCNLPDSLWLGTSYLATDFGWLRQDVEGGCFNGDQIMYCAVIDSIQYGNCIYLGIDDNPFEKIINGFELNQNYPNPFNNQTIITYKLPRSVFVNLSIYSIDGKKITTLISKGQHQGIYDVVWEGRDSSGRVVSSGVYIYTLNAGAYKESGKMILIK